MTEWSIVLVISTLLALLAVVVRPVISLTQAITKLTATVEGIQADFEIMNVKNHDSHKRIWDHNELQAQKLAEHDKRISRLEDQ